MIKVTLRTSKSRIAALKIALGTESLKATPPATHLVGPPHPFDLPCGEIVIAVSIAHGKETEFLELVLNTDIIQVDDVTMSLE